jgi:hypothetical protein
MTDRHGERPSRRTQTMWDELEVWPAQRKKNHDKVFDRYLAKRRRRNTGTGAGQAWRELDQTVRELREDIDV